MTIFSNRKNQAGGFQIDFEGMVDQVRNGINGREYEQGRQDKIEITNVPTLSSL